METLATPQFLVERPALSILAQRRELELLRAYQDHLATNGHTVDAHVYRIPDVGVVACDLFDQTTGTLYEAKGDVRRESLRMAVGQLLDYRRFEPPGTQVAVLLPRRPHADLTAFLKAVGITLVHRDHHGWETVNS